MTYEKFELHVSSVVGSLATALGTTGRTVPRGKQLFTRFPHGGKMKRTFLVLCLSCLFIIPGFSSIQAENELGLIKTDLSPELLDSLSRSKGEPSLQEILDDLGYNIDVENDKLPTEIWEVIAGQYSEIMLAEVAEYSDQTASGWYAAGSPDDTTIIFVPEDTPPETSYFYITGCDSNGLFIAPFAGGGKCRFVYYTEPALNPDHMDHAWVFCSKQRPNEFIIAWEDLFRLGDHDFNDLILAYRMPNRAPVLDLPENTNFLLCEAGTVCFNISAHDYCGDTISIAKLQGPGVFDQDAGTCCFLPASVDSAYEFVFVATDCFGAADTDTVVITVEFNQPPQLTCPQDGQVNAGDVFISTCFSLSDPNGTSGVTVVLDTILPTPKCYPILMGNKVRWRSKCEDLVTGPDFTITLIATDSCGAADTCEFMVTVYNLPPEIVCPDDDSVNAGDRFVSSNFSTSDPKCYPVVNLCGITPTPTYMPIKVRRHVEWRTDCADAGKVFTICLEATDKCGAKDTCYFEVTVYNRPPQITCPDDDSVHAGDLFVSSNFSASDPKCYPMVNLCGITPTSTHMPTKVQKHVEWQTDCADAGKVFTICLEATDKCGATDTCHFQVTVYDQPPQITCPDGETVDSGHCLSGDFTVNDPDGDSAAGTQAWVDPAGCGITNLSVHGGTGPVPANGHVEFDADSLFPGDYTIYLEATSGCGLKDTCSFLITVSGRAPVITSTPDTLGYVGHLYTYDVEATGIPAPVFHLYTSPTGMTIDTITGVIQWTPTAVGDSDVCVEAINSAGADTQCFTITVEEPAHVSIIPDYLMIKCDHEDTLWIHVDDRVLDLDSAFFKIVYEDTLLTSGGVIKGPDLSPPTNFTLSFAVLPDSILIYLKALGSSFDGPGTILGILLFASDKEVPTRVDIERSGLYDSSGDPILHETSGADIEFDCGTAVEGEDGEGGRPSAYTLSQNYPNPYNPVTQIAYQLPQAGHVSIKIYNIKGQLVRTLVDEHKAGGSYAVTWDGRNDDETAVSSGIYFYRIHAGKFTDTKKMVLIR
jgi:hypothetical protein